MQSIVLTLPARQCTLPPSCSKKRLRAKSWSARETAKLCRSPLDLTARKTSSGIADRLIEVYRLNARPDDVDHNDVARRYQNPIVDRVDELAALRERLPRLGGKSCSVALLGEPGIGKSRLATAAMTDALTSEVRCCVFYGAVQRRITAFAVARALVGDMLGARSLSSDDHLREALAELGVEASDRRTLETLFIVEKSSSRQTIERQHTNANCARTCQCLPGVGSQQANSFADRGPPVDRSGKPSFPEIARAREYPAAALHIADRPAGIVKPGCGHCGIDHSSATAVADQYGGFGTPVVAEKSISDCACASDRSRRRCPLHIGGVPAFGGRDERNERTITAPECRVRDSCAATTAFTEDQDIRANTQPVRGGELKSNWRRRCSAWTLASY